MKRPIETLLTLPRVKLERRIPISEFTRSLQFYSLDLILKYAREISERSKRIFYLDETVLSAILTGLIEGYKVTLRSQVLLRELLTDVYHDARKFSVYEQKISPYRRIDIKLDFETSQALDKAEECKGYAEDIGDLMSMKIPAESPLIQP